MFDSIKLKKATPTSEGEPVIVRYVGKGPVVSIPTKLARRLGLVEGVSKLTVTLEDGALVYRLKSEADTP